MTVLKYQQPMTLYQKAVLTMIVTTSVVVLASFLVANFVLMPALLAHEQHTIEERGQTLSAALERAVADVSGTASDYAGWDRSYDIMVHKNPEYPRIDLSDHSFEKYDIQLLLMVSLDG